MNFAVMEYWAIRISFILTTIIMIIMTYYGLKSDLTIGLFLFMTMFIAIITFIWGFAFMYAPIEIGLATLLWLYLMYPHTINFAAALNKL